MSVRKFLILVLVVASISVSCEREDRGFRANPPDCDRIGATQLTTLKPGQDLQPPAVMNEYENNAYAMSEGKRLFQQMNCSGCHAHGGGAIGPALMDDKWIYGSRPEQIFATIVEGRPNGMPAFHDKLPDYQVWQIAAYVRSLSGLANSDAAPGRNDDMKVGKPENSRRKETPKPLAIPQP
jgi:cytochrome c oxidase cbb3-type subunit 3